jgi:outer membrane protein assembly factor BamB
MNLNTIARLGVLALAALSCGCLGTNKNPPKKPAAVALLEAGSNRTRPALDDERVNQFGFQTYWDAYIRDEVITSLTMEGDQLYVFSESKRLYQVDMHSGMVNWVFDVGRPLMFVEGGRPISEYRYPYRRDDRTKQKFKLYDEIFFIAGDHLYAVDKKNGSELWQIYLPFTPSSAPEAGKTHVYIGSWDDRVYAIRKDRPLIPDWSWRTGNDVLARPVAAGPTVFVASTDGQLHSFEAGKGKPKRPFTTERSLKQDPLVFNHLLYLPAEDFNLYVVGATDGLLHHREGAGASISGRPVAIERSIYFPAEGEGMFSLLRKGRPKKTEGNPRKVTHELRWKREGATQVLCKGMRDVYLLEPQGGGTAQISRIDADEGNFRDGIEFSGVDHWITNAYSPLALDKEDALRGGIVIMGFRNGWLFAIKETATIPGA